MPTEPKVEISLSQQSLRLLSGNTELNRWSISSALNGSGEREGSGCTPRGVHCIAEKIGDAAPLNAVFVGRVPTGEIYDEQLASAYPDRDWILTRILWLAGTELGKNLGGELDSQARYIYIHGTPDREPMGIPQSHGCIRMRNQDVIALFEQVQVGTEVRIEE